MPRKLTTEEFIEKSKKIHGEKYDYSLVEYKNRIKKVKIICPLHGVFEQYPHIHYRGVCPKCNESVGERTIRLFLEMKHINYLKQFKFNNCRNILPLPFDFYLPDLNICVEYDGRYHFEIIEQWGGINNLIYVQKNDEIKNNYCKENNIKLIRIKYDENVNEILQFNFPD